MSGPALTFATRDQHWQAVRHLMRDRQLDCLLIGGFRARERYDSFVTDDHIEGSVVFPLEGEPVALTWTNMRVLRALDSAERGEELWAHDYRVAPDGPSGRSAFADSFPRAIRLSICALRSSGNGCDLK